MERTQQSLSVALGMSRHSLNGVRKEKVILLVSGPFPFMYAEKYILKSQVTASFIGGDINFPSALLGN